MTPDLAALVERLKITRSYLANHPTRGSWTEARVVEEAIAALELLAAENYSVKEANDAAAALAENKHNL